MRHPLLQRAVLVTLLLAPCSFVQAGSNAQPVPVTVQSVSDLLIHIAPDAQATVVSLNDTQISAEVSGTVKTVAVQAGAQVKNGDLLLELDGWEYQTQLEQAKAALEEVTIRREQAQRQLERSQELNKQGQSSAEQLEQRQTELKALESQAARLKAEQKLAKQRLDKCRITAPFAGVILERPAQNGQTVTVGQPLLRLVDLVNVELVAQVDASEAERLAVGSDWFFSDSSGRFPLSLRTVMPVVDTRTHTREARFGFVNAKPAPGSTGRVSWHSTVNHLPPHVLVHRNGELGIFLANDQNKALFTPLPGAQEGRPAPILTPLEGQIVVIGREILQGGEDLQIVQKVKR